METGKIILLTAPSGSGKTTLVKRMLELFPGLEFSISACTRPPRSGEQHGKDYYFFSEEEFKELINKKAFVEWEMVYPGKYYGTLREELERIWEKRHVPVMDVDVYGARAMQAQFPSSSLSIFIQAPSLEVLRARLASRSSETPESIEERLSKAQEELKHAPHFHHILVNDQLEEATQKLKKLIAAFLNEG